MDSNSKIALIVEPDEETALGIARKLATLGLESLTASGVDNAVETLGWLNPDLVLVGQGYESENGVRRLSRNSTEEAPLVFVSDDGDAAAMGAAVWQGADECLMHPFDEELLEFKLQQTGVL